MEKPPRAVMVTLGGSSMRKLSVFRWLPHLDSNQKPFD
jgi:hypothetical protein